nr:MAG TPA: hypothetical protein [Caudoviricetes sp.]
MSISTITLCSHCPLFYKGSTETHNLTSVSGKLVQRYAHVATRFAVLLYPRLC